MNDFSKLSAEDGISALALLVPEELEEANAYYDEMQESIDTAFEAASLQFDTPADMRKARYEAKLAFQRQIHEEIEPELNHRKRRAALFDVATEDDNLIF